MKKTKRFMSLILSLILCLSMTISSYASNNNTQNLEYSVNYQTDNMNNIIEEASFSDGINTLTSHRIISPSGTAILTTTIAGESETITQQVDYTLFAKLAQVYTTPPYATARAVNVHDSSIFNHTLVTTMSQTLKGATLDAIVTAGSPYLASLLISAGWAATIAGVIAGLAYLSWSVNQPDHAIVSYSMYEVTFKTDNLYYCFCYHYTIQDYDSGGHPIGSPRTGTYESIGG